MSKQNFSYSKLATFLECPKRYELQYIRNLVEFKETIYTAFGEAVHKAIELTINNKYDFDQAVAIFEKKLKECMMQMNQRDAQLIFVNEWHNKGKVLLQRFFDTYYKEILNNKMSVIGTEKYFTFEILPNIFYNGIIDLLVKHAEEIKETVKIPVEKILKSGKRKIVYQKIENTKQQEKYKIIDWKTGAIKTNENLQLLSYTIPLLNDNIFIEEIIYAFLKYEKDIKLKVDKNLINITKNKIIGIINNIIQATNNNKFDMCIDKNKCKYCNVKKACDEDFKLLLDSLNKVN